MSDRMSVAEAREWLPMAESHDVNANISRLLRTAISQAEQIERLQAAVRDLMEDYLDADAEIFSERGLGEYVEPNLADYGLTTDLMEPPA